MRLVLQRTVATLVLGPATVWASLAIHYSNLPWPLLRTLGALVFAGASAGLFLRLGLQRRSLMVFGLAWLSVLAWWSNIPARNDRDWVPAHTRICEVHFEGDVVELRGLRAFRYSDHQSTTRAYLDQRYELRALVGVDLGFSYWGETEAIAHTFLSFAFEGGEQLAVSIEARREQGESYSPLKGMFRQYELFYVLGDERDVIRLRTNGRGERTYLYPTTMPPHYARALLRDILETNRELAEVPMFYRTLARNCTTALVKHFDAIALDPLPFDGALLLNGYSDRLAYRRGMLDTTLPFPEARQAHRVSGIAQELEDGPDFSRELRLRLFAETGAFRARMAPAPQ